MLGSEENAMTSLTIAAKAEMLIRSPLANVLEAFVDPRSERR
jgi:hypothetical protein